MVEEKKKAGPHNVVMEDRKRLTVTASMSRRWCCFATPGSLRSGEKDFISIESMWTQEN